MIYFTSDPHFGHTNIMKYSPFYRDYPSVDAMNEAIISSWNSTVKNENDIIFMLGDFSYIKNHSDNEALFRRLNGKKHLIVGNHDHKSTKSLNWETRHQYYELRENGDTFVLFHYPIDSDWNRSNHNSYHLHGHIHSTPTEPKISTQTNRLDVGWDLHGKILSLPEAKKYMKDRSDRIKAAMQTDPDF